MGKITKDKNKPIIIKLNDVASKHRLLKLRNLKVMNNGRETNVHFNPDRTILELESLRILGKEVKLRQAMADQKNLNVKYIIRNNKIVELTRQPFCFRSQNSGISSNNCESNCEPRVLNTSKNLEFSDKFSINHNKLSYRYNNCNSIHVRTEHFNIKFVLVKVDILENYLYMNNIDFFYLNMVDSLGQRCHSLPFLL